MLKPIQGAASLCYDCSMAKIYKAAGLIIRDRKVLVSRSKGKDVFVQPGGKLENGETYEQALVRELSEEQGALVNPENFTPYGVYEAIAAGHESEQLELELHAYLVDYDGTLQPSSEIDENRWINSDTLGSLVLGSIMEHDIVPRLVADNLID